MLRIGTVNVGRALAPARPEKRRFRCPPRERRPVGREQDAVGASREYVRSVTRRTQIFDAVLAAVVLLLGQAEAWGGVFSSELTGPRWALAVAYAICAVALAFRRRDPLAVALVIAAVFIAEFAAFGSSEGLGTFLIPLIAAYTLGADTSPRHGLTGLAALLAMGAVWDALDPSDAGRLTEHVGQVIWLSPWVVAFLFGLYWRSRRLNLEQAARGQADAPNAPWLRSAPDRPGTARRDRPQRRGDGRADLGRLPAAARRSGQGAGRAGDGRDERPGGHGGDAQDRRRAALG